ncbi:MAG TPA: hypothetical protein VL286_00895, partial [Rhizomicrobium sp.]|nr:hypothetical protein [Rhizomicrobium sp.]
MAAATGSLIFTEILVERARVDERESRLWDDMLAEFRALGGTADNVRLGQGRFGRGLFPCDPSLPVRIRIPDNLLVDWRHVEFEDNTFRIGAGAQIGAREKTFLENYYRDFSWGTGQPEILDLLHMMHEAPADLREMLKSFYAFRWLEEEPTDKTVQDRFLDSRVISYNGADVIMPIVELANHDHATRYQASDGVGLSGTFSGEILVQYQLCDPLQIFGKWGFVSDSESFALSLPMKPGSIGVGIQRRDVEQKPGAAPFYPTVKSEGFNITLSCLMLGNKNFPRLARGIFYRIMRDAGRRDAEEVFDFVQHANRMQFYKL